MQKKPSFIVFDNLFMIHQTNYPSLDIYTDIRDFFYEIRGMEENILALEKEQRLDIPMLLRNNNYYDITIELFSLSPKWYLFNIQIHSQYINQYTNTLKEINKSALSKEIQDARKKDEYTAQRDTLTGLANRSYLLKEIDNYTNKQTSFTLCLLDINNFHTLNDEYGSHAGDMLLKHISTLLTNIFNENVFISRIFADCFALLIYEEEHTNTIDKQIATIEKKIQQNPLRYTQEDIISFQATLCFEYYNPKYTDAKLFLEHLQNSMKRKKIDKRLTR